MTIKRVLNSLAKPKVLSGLMVIAYLAVIVFASFRSIPYLLAHHVTTPLSYLAVFLILFSSPFAIFSAWRGWVAMEMVALPGMSLALALGFIIDVQPLLDPVEEVWNAILLLLFLLGIALTARYYYLWEVRKIELGCLDSDFIDHRLCRDDNQCFLCICGSRGKD